MSSPRRWAAAGALLTALALPPAASGGEPFTVGQGREPHVLVESGGTGHVVWADPAAKKVRYCRVPRGAASCSATATLNMPGTVEPDNPYLLRGSGSTLYVAMAHYVGTYTLLWQSADNGASWSAPKPIYDIPTKTDSSEPVLGPLPDEITFASSNPGREVWGARINESEAGLGTASPLPGGSGVNEDLGIAPTGDGGLIAVANDLTNTHWWRMAPGADPSLNASWTGPTSLGAMNTSRVAGGPGGAYVLASAGSAGSRRMEIRKFAGGSMGAPRVLADEEGYINDVTVGPTGAVGAIWRRNDSPHRLRFALSRDGGATYAVLTIAREPFVMSSMDVSLAGDGQGFAVYHGGPVDGGVSEIRVVSTDKLAEPGDTPPPAAPPAGPPGPGTTGPGTTGPGAGPAPGTGPGSGSGTPISQTTVGDQAISFFGPTACVQPPEKVTLRVTSQRKRKLSPRRRAKITRVVFSVGRTKVTDRRKPFKASFSTARFRRGSVHQVRAVVTLAPVKKRAFKTRRKTLRGRFNVCG